MAAAVQGALVRREFRAGTKLGIVLGEDCDVVSVRDESSAYWAGVKKGWTIRSINDAKVDKTTVKPALLGAIRDNKKIRILFEKDTADVSARNSRANTPGLQDGLLLSELQETRMHELENKVEESERVEPIRYDFSPTAKISEASRELAKAGLKLGNFRTSKNRVLKLKVDHTFEYSMNSINENEKGSGTWEVQRGVLLCTGRFELQKRMDSGIHKSISKKKSFYDLKTWNFSAS